MHEALLESGFIPDEPESIMIGEASALAVDVPLPDGVTLRQVMTEFDVCAMGKRLIHSDSTEFSRSILERSGFVKVSTTTPFRWTR